MGKKKAKKPNHDNTIALNRKARHDFALEKNFEAGIVLEGWEVKSLRDGRAQIADSYVILKKGEAFLLNALITPLISASTHIKANDTRTRKLLLHKKELEQLIGYVERSGYTLVPTSLYWKKNRVKVAIALAKGKKLHDKRASAKEQDWKREKARIFKNKT